ncbi:MAG TPA: hypothetical protein VFV67_34115 [Actinophytocola sp.]|uniref:hypothetical protein n=1 Tax=Actinophytocola sp. TaxID=1872138 RepID=UPI002DB89CFD|nr:hypothetical protein [Actinophytocola sp.]HEU5475704.1 hypothetical protein [Actinophytocola sp.]
MADTYFPFDAGSGANVTEAQWADMARLWAPDGLGADTPRVSLGSGLQFSIPDGLYGWCKGFFYKNVTVQTKTASANGNTNPRIDRLVLRLDRTANTVTPTIIQGTPAASPTPPAITAATDIPVARATCPGSGSAQNYNTLVQEWWPVSSLRGSHVWTRTQVVADNVGAVTLTSWTQQRSDGIVTLTGSNFKLNLPGLWSIRLFVFSDSSPTGVFTSNVNWTNGPWQESMSDTRRRPAFPADGPGFLRSNATFTGMVFYDQAQQNINVSADWVTPTTDDVSVVASIYFDYLGG